MFVRKSVESVKPFIVLVCGNVESKKGKKQLRGVLRSSGGQLDVKEFAEIAVQVLGHGEGKAWGTQTEAEFYLPQEVMHQEIIPQEVVGVDKNPQDMV